MTKIKLILILCFSVQITVSAQVKIGDNPNTINGASLLELETSGAGTSKGFVPPRVALISLTSSLPLPAGLLTGTVIFNTASGVGTGVGLYYWSGTGWVAAGSGAVSTAWSLTGNANTDTTVNFLGTTDGKYLNFKTNNKTAVTISPGGNVNIGLPSNGLTNSTLGVANTIELKNTFATGASKPATVSQFLFSNSNGINGADVRMNNDGGDFYFQGGGGRNTQLATWWTILLSGDREVGTAPSFVYGNNSGDPLLNTGVLVRAQRAVSVPFAIQSISGQTANLTEWRDASSALGKVLNVVNASGQFGIGITNPPNALSVLATNPLYLSGVQATSTLTSDSVLTINAGVVKKVPSGSFTIGNSWLTAGNDNTTITTSSFLGSVAGTAVPLLFKAQGDTVGYLGLKTTSNAVSFGVGASGANTAVSSVAIGAGAKATAGNAAIALGLNATAGSFQDIAIGANAQTATSSSNIAIGAGAQATSSNAIALGSNATASTNQIALAIGVNTSSTGFTSMAIGNGAKSSNTNTTAFGALATASAISANAFGNRSNATGDSSLAVGNLSAASKSNSIAIGTRASASSVYSTVLGTNSSATGDSTTVIGNNLAVTASNVLILGAPSKNIGMGTIAPAYKLTIVPQTGNDPLYINGVQSLITPLTTDSILAIRAGVVKQIRIADLPSGSGWSLTGNSGTNASTNFIGTTDSVDLVIKAAKADYIHILGKSNGASQPGWVGIGNTLPRSRLDVTGVFSNKNVITIQNTSTGGYSSVDMYSAGGTLSGTFGFANTGVTNTAIAGKNYFYYYNNDFIMTSGNGGGGSPDLFIQGSTGNVGMGTANPTNKLSVLGTNPLYLSGVQATATLTSDSVLTILNGVVKKAPSSSLSVGGGSGWSLTGNLGTSGTAGTNFVGTTDDKGLVFKVNNTVAGMLGTTNDGGARTSYGLSSSASDQNTTAIGPSAKAGAIGAVALGFNAQATVQNAVALGQSALANATGALAVGSGSQATKQNALAYGNNSVASGTNSSVEGNNSNAAADNTLVVGTGTTVSGLNSGAIGSGMTVTQSNAFIVGNPANNLNIGIGTLTPNTNVKVDVAGPFKLGTAGSVTKTSESFSGSVNVSVAANSGSFGEATITIPNGLSGTQASVAVSPNFDLPNGIVIAFARATSTTQIKIRFMNTTGTAQTVSGTVYCTVTEF